MQMYKELKIKLHNKIWRSFFKIQIYRTVEPTFQQSWQLRSDYVFVAHFTGLFLVNYKFQAKTVAFILESDHSFLQAWIVQTLYSNIVINSRPILQKSISMSTLST